MSQRTVHNLHHVNIETARLSETVAFYQNVLGVVPGTRPSFPSTGIWLYLGDDPILHILEIPEIETPTGRFNRLDHFGVMCTGFEETKCHLDEQGYAYKLSGVNNDRMQRIFVEDPNGVVVELSFLMDASRESEETAPPDGWNLGAKFYD